MTEVGSGDMDEPDSSPGQPDEDASGADEHAEVPLGTRRV
jgi:hypothetical protein